jgi:glycerophosphoryl diester phosphodiesterase
VGGTVFPSEGHQSHLRVASHTLFFIRLCPKSEVSYLNGELSPMELKELGFTGLDYHYKVLQSHPDWVKDCKVLGMTSNVWTVDDPKLMEEIIFNWK